jgi:hypothetical protein
MFPPSISHQELLVADRSTTLAARVGDDPSRSAGGAGWSLLLLHSALDGGEQAWRPAVTVR